MRQSRAHISASGEHELGVLANELPLLPGEASLIARFFVDSNLILGNFYMTRYRKGSVEFYRGKATFE